MQLYELVADRLRGYAATAILVGARVYPLELPLQATLPAITYRLISDDPQYTHDGPSGLTNSRISVLAWAATFVEAAGLGEAVRAALERYQYFRRITKDEQLDPESGRYYVVQDFRVWHPE